MRAIVMVLVLVLGACSDAADPQAPDGAIIAPHDTAGSAQPDGGDGGDGGDRIDAPPSATPPLLAINEVAASESPDWFEVKNLSGVTLTLSDFLYVDTPGDFMKARTLPAITLAPGGYYVQDVDDATTGFKLGSDEELHLYRASDRVEVDGVDWADGASPPGGSYARVPDGTGGFATTAAPTPGTSNGS